MFTFLCDFYQLNLPWVSEEALDLDLSSVVEVAKTLAILSNRLKGFAHGNRHEFSGSGVECYDLGCSPRPLEFSRLVDKELLFLPVN